MNASARAAKPRVLVVDDNEDAAYVACQLLRLHGYDARTACDGSAALGLLAEFHPQMVMLDINMPGMSGYEVARAVRAMAPAAARPVLVALTARQEAADVAFAFDAGFDHHLGKPAADLVERVDAFFAASPAGPC